MDTPSSSDYSIFDLLGIAVEAAKDLKYLTPLQEIQIACVSIGSGIGLYLTTHSIQNAIIAVAIFAGTHIIAMAQEGVKAKKNTALGQVEQAGDDAVAAAQTTATTGSSASQAAEYIKSES